MSWITRPGLEARLAGALTAPRPAVMLLRGPTGSGKSGLLRTVLPRRLDEGSRTVALAGTSGPAFRHLPGWRTDVPTPEGSMAVRGPAGWNEGWSAVADHLLAELDSRRPLVLVLDDVRLLQDGDGGLDAALARVWTGARARGLPLLIIACDRDDASLDALVAERGPLAGAEAYELRVGPVSWTDLRRHFADWSPTDRFLLHASLGGLPATLGRVDPDVRLATNLQRLVVDPDGVLHRVPERRLAAEVQRTDRYAGVVAALAEGAREWGEILTANPAFPSGNQLAPYLATLQDRGWVEARRSLDALPRSRRTRYALVDPFVGFWYAAVEPALGALLAGTSPGEVWRSRVRAASERHARRRLPAACRSALLERGDDVLPIGPRTIGGLWGEGYDLPVSGTLRNGGALYGFCVDERMATVSDADDAMVRMKATRYGFGRQARLRVIFTGRGATEALVRRAARDELLMLVPIEHLF